MIRFSAIALLFGVGALQVVADTSTGPQEELARPPEIFEKGSVVLFIGDSITHGGRAGDMNHYLGHGYQAEIAMRYLAYRPEDDLQFANRGISGDRSAGLVRRWHTDAFPFRAGENGYAGAFATTNAVLTPDCLSILIGINDYMSKVKTEDYERNLRYMVTNSLAANPKLRIVLCEPFRLPVDTSPDFLRMQKTVRDLATEYDLAFVPFQRLFTEKMLAAKNRAKYWFWDQYHPTYAAHMLMADFWIETVAREFAAGKGRPQSPCAPTSISLDGRWQLVKDGVTSTVTVPHDWAIAGPFDPKGNDDTAKLPCKGAGVYSRTFVLSDCAWATLNAGGAAYLTLNGAMANPTVTVNGCAAGGWDYGYMSFTLSVGALLRPGTNTVAVACDSRAHTSRWYPGGGLYRSVRLEVKGPGHVIPGSVFITTPRVTRKSADVCVVYELAKEGVLTNSFTVAKPRLWSPDDPYLYEVTLAGEKFRYGIRTVAFTADDGFFLNGARLQLKGVCLHSDLGPLGMAFSKDAARRQLAIMKDMGANAIRLSHNPSDPAFLDLCDEMGFVVWNECFDKWDGTAGLAQGAQPEPLVERNLRAFVRRDRNHPCVAVWSIGNEIPAAAPDYPNGVTRERCTRFREVVRALDPTRPVGIGAWEAPTAACFEDLDVTGWNYARRYLPVRKMFPKKPLVYTETCSSFSTAGFYSLPLPRGRSDYAVSARACDGYDLTAAWYSDIPDVEFERVTRDSYLAGEFVWTGFDYLGEPSPYQHGFNAMNKWGLKPAELSRSSYYGIVGLDGIPKDRFYLYRSHWNKKSETAHLVPGRWNFKSGEKVPVFLYASGDEAELFLNGRSLGRRKKACDVPSFRMEHDVKDNEPAASWEKHPYYSILPKYRLVWEGVPFEPGRLEAVAYRSGREVARTALVTAGKPVAVRLEDDPYSRPGDTMRFVRVSLVDKAGVRVPDSRVRVSFSIAGAGEIAAVGNADSNGHDSFARTDSHPLFAGWAVLAVRRTGPDEIRLTASAAGLKSVQFSIRDPAVLK